MSMIEHGSADIKSQLDAGASISDFAIVEFLEYIYSALSDTKMKPRINHRHYKDRESTFAVLWGCLFLLNHGRDN